MTQQSEEHDGVETEVVERILKEFYAEYTSNDEYHLLVAREIIRALNALVL